MTNSGPDTGKSFESVDEAQATVYILPQGLPENSNIQDTEMPQDGGFVNLEEIGAVEKIDCSVNTERVKRCQRLGGNSRFFVKHLV